MPRQAQPEERATWIDKERRKVRRKYSSDKQLKRPRKFIPGEEEFVGVQVAVLKISGYTNAQIGRTLGVSKGQVSEFLKKPEVADLVLSLRRTLPAAAIELMQSFMIEGVMVLVEIMRQSGDDKIRVEAVKELFDRGGVPKISRQERKQESEEVVKFNDEALVDRIRELPPEKQEEAAQMIEALSNFLNSAVENENGPVE